MIYPAWRGRAARERFEDHVQRIPFHSCWEWSGVRLKGYGRLRVGGTRVMAHRLAWEFAFGPIPGGLQVCHACDNPGCVRPDHLFLGTNAENAQDKVRKGRAASMPGEKNPSARIDETRVRRIRALRRAGLTIRAISERFGMSHSQIGNIVRGKHWRTVA